MLASIPSPSFNQFDLGPLSVSLYGLMIALGVIAAARLAERRWAARGGDPDDMGSIAIWAVAAGVVGARLYHVITDWRRFEGRWLEIFAIWEGGLGIPGGLVAGTAVGAWIAHRRNIPVLRLLDAAAPAIPIAQAIGRLGNWFNQELFGEPTDLPWALRIDPMHRPAGLAAVETYHPTFLYEALGNLILAMLLVFAVERRFRLRPGQLFTIYVGGYALLRFGVESIRIDTASEILGWRVNLWTSAITIAVAAAIVVARRRPAEREPSPGRVDDLDESEPAPRT
ncbi:MAG: prolipoprotein diacylglyceryl transferase [Ilumatobacteraceae bacterium]|nr:prolipoprotein diacylglyceryl transferase [Ilumatobacteraceae bacterium]